MQFFLLHFCLVCEDLSVVVDSYLGGDIKPGWPSFLFEVAIFGRFFKFLHQFEELFP